jgi:hypothetical protein
MSPEAEGILNVFRSKSLKADAFVKFWDFGDAIVWKDGFVRDEGVRQALTELNDQGYTIEHNAALQLTAKGAQHLYGE